MNPTVRRVLAALVLVLAIASLSACGQAVSVPPLEQNPQAQTVPLQIAQGPNGATLALAPVLINGRGPYAFALDTGASQSLIDRNIVNQLNLPIVGKPEQVTGVSGTEQADLVQINQWRVGDVTLPAKEAITVALPEPNKGVGLAGLLGSDVLADFGVITIDYQQAVLTLGGR